MTVDPDTQRAAAEHVLRLSPEEEARDLLARAAQDEGLRREIADWEVALSPLLDDLEPVAPRRAVRRRIDAALFGRKRPAWPGVLPWLIAGTASVALAAALFLPIAQGPDPAAPLIVAEIATEGDALRVLAAYDPAAGGFRVARTAGTAPPGRDFELWAIGSAGVPVSLGLLPESGLAALPEALRGEVATLTLAISREPEGGSPTGSPTEVLAAVPVSTL